MNNQTFTHEFMRSNCGCYSEEKLMQCSFMKNDSVTLYSIFHSKIPLVDKYWFFCRKVATKEQNQKISIDVAEIVLPIFENKYPGDLRARNAIQAAKDFLSGQINSKELIEKSAAAYAAYDAAARAAYDAAASAAYAAYAASAANAARAAYDAAAYAAYADSIEQQLFNYLLTYLD